MSLEEKKAIIRRLFAALNKQDLSVLNEIMLPEFAESNKQFMTPLWKGFPDLHVSVDDIIAEGDKVWVRVKETGTHTGEYRGLAPTGKKTTFTAVHIWRIVDGKIVEKESVYDSLDFLKELGAIEYKGFPDEDKSLEKNKAIVREVIESINNRDLTELDKFMAHDFVDYTNQARGRENVKKFYTMAFKDFPDFHRTIEDITAEGDKVWVRCEVKGTASTGKKMELTSVAIYRIYNGKVVEGWGGVIQKMSVPKATEKLYEKLL